MAKKGVSVVGMEHISVTIHTPTHWCVWIMPVMHRYPLLSVRKTLVFDRPRIIDNSLLCHWLGDMVGVES